MIIFRYTFTTDRGSVSRKNWLKISSGLKVILKPNRTPNSCGLAILKPNGAPNSCELARTISQEVEGPEDVVGVAETLRLLHRLPCFCYLTASLWLAFPFYLRDVKKQSHVSFLNHSLKMSLTRTLMACGIGHTCGLVWPCIANKYVCNLFAPCFYFAGAGGPVLR